MVDQLSADAAERRLDAYVASLRRRLYGSRVLKAGMLRELRHGLEDASEARREAGLDADEAARRAVAEFGRPEVVAAAIQRELAARLSRAALVLLALGAPLGEVLARITWSNVDPGLTTAGSERLRGLSTAIDVFGWGVCVAAVAALLWMGMSARHGRFAGRVALAVGCGLAAASATFAAGGATLMIGFDAPWFWAVPEPLLVLNSLFHLTWWSGAAWLSWRCLRVSRVLRACG